MRIHFCVETAENGYVLEYDNPDVVRRNRSSDGWEDPERRVLCKDDKALGEAMIELSSQMAEYLAAHGEDDTRELEVSKGFKDGFSTRA